MDVSRSFADRIAASLRLWQRLRRDTRAAVAVELALLIVPFLGLLMTIFQAGFAFFASEGLDAAVQDAARNIYTGIAQANRVYTADAFRTNYLCPAGAPRVLPSFIDCSKLIIDVRTSASFTGANTRPDFYQSSSTRQFCPGAPGDIVIVRVIYPMPVIVPVIVGTTTNTIGQFRVGLVDNVPGAPGWRQILMGTAVFENEPYSASTYSAPAGC